MPTWTDQNMSPHNHGPLWQPFQRCQECGHRVNNPIQTREYPIWWWPFELVNRLQAKMVKYLPQRLQ